MTERLYYDDAYLWEFEAKVTSVRNGTRPGEWEITLDRSAFYPTSGGQPFDTGTLTFGKAKAKVTDAEAAVGEFVSEGHIGGVLQIEVDEKHLLGVALQAIELFLQFKSGHTTCSTGV